MRRASAKDIVVPVRQTITVDQAMKLASLQETVTVSGSSPTVDVENTKVGARLSQEILTVGPDLALDFRHRRRCSRA